MLYRKISEDINKWIDEGKDALLITGARQVGKTYLVRELLKEKNKDYVEFNFIKQPNLISLFDAAIKEDAITFLENLRLASKRVLKDETIIFFDEVQECKEIVTIIKFLVEQGKYRYILSGSLLGVELKDLRSAPVGYMTTLDMYPLDLEEFYLAYGLTGETIKKLRNCFDSKIAVDSFTHARLIEAFYKYLVIGGMPEAVQSFKDNGDYNLVNDIHQKIIRDYKRDFTKYEKQDKLLLLNVYNLIPSELNKKNKRYVIGDLKNGAHFSRYVNNFLWLVDAGVAIPVYNASETKMPLEASKKSTLFKLFLSDVGLLSSAYGTSTIIKMLSKDNDINYGSIYENFVAMELLAHGFNNLYYFNNKLHGEIDFLIECEGNILPLEIKSGKDYTVHSAMSYFCSNAFTKGIVFSNYNIKVDGNITYYPIYMLMFLTANKRIEKKDNLDLSFL